ncbi:MAG TPA: hypothetical protein VK504_26340 [Vicinamibacterales bacterium]|nr:hypothetical protein [Vicinamibacterales bacterium]
MRRAAFALVVLLCAVPLRAQQPTPAEVAAEDPADEKGKIAKNCLFKHVVGCLEVLFTGQPLHIAVGSLPPQNGFAYGLAYVGRKDTKSGNWRISWNGDAALSSSRSWRGGLYVNFVDSRISQAEVDMGTGNANMADIRAYIEQPVYTLYVQTISLNKLTMFGLGPETLESGRSYYGMSETVAGASGVRPIYSHLNMGVYGEINGRSVDVRPSPNQESPSIEQLYGPADAPGLNDHPFFLQLGAGVRMRPSDSKKRLHLNYDVAYRPFFDTSGSELSFQRLTVDLGHELSLYHTHMRVPRDTNGPDDCAIDPGDARSRCQPIAKTSTKEGSIGFRAFTSLSRTSSANAVPFYFQPTVGGADINGNNVLGSYQDYRFRARNLLLLRESFEHSFGKLPVGFIMLADQAKLANAAGDLGRAPWIQSYAAGITLRAGGLPIISLLFAFGGHEGTHTILNMGASLLGSSGRPSLF